MVRVAPTDSEVLSLFSAPVAKWFGERHGTATEPQIEAWPLIKRGENVLIHSPTGSGKTLAAFLSALDALYSDVALSKRKGIRTLYISPLKALGYDVERNLEEPMRGIERAARSLGIEFPEVRSDVRTGDTPSSARARMVRNPPHILITTPESLYLILTSPRARSILSTVETVIVDEIHTLCANKRGVHLSITLERLEQVAPGFQRIGLSATQRPLTEVARLLGGQNVSSAGSSASGSPLCPSDISPASGGNPNDEVLIVEPRPVSIVDCPGSKKIEISVHGMPDTDGGDPSSIWPKLIPRVLDDIEGHDTTLVFSNSRRQAENAADRLNAVWSAREHGDNDGATVGRGAIGTGGEDGPFMAHHGSLSDTLRRDIEEKLKAGELPALVGTSSLELGIDIGSIDLVVQLQSPKTVTQGLQRVGRAGHSVGETSYGKIYGTHPEDLIEAAVVARGMQERRVEAVEVPRNSLDVLAQQVVAAVAVQDWPMPELYRVIKGAYPYGELTYPNFEGVVKLVSGHYPRELFSTLRARIHWDQTRDVLQQLPGTRMIAISNGGAIVDRGLFQVVLPDRKTRVGELDEEFVFESGEGDAFMLGSQVWRVAKIDDDRVIAEPAPGAVPRMPFWRGDFPWRPLDLSKTLAKFRAEAAKRVMPYVSDETTPDELVEWLMSEYPIDEAGARQIFTYIRGQIRWCGDISSHKTVIVEVYQDSIGDQRIVVHSPFGGRINGPWSVAIARELLKRRKVEPEVQVSDDGFMFRLPQGDGAPDFEFIREMSNDIAKEHILEGMIDSPLFGAVFRQNAYRALLLPSLGQFRRTPFWLQRLRSKDLLAIAKSFPDFPIVLESYRDALEDYMDMPGLERILEQIHSGEIEVKFVESDVPSPVARSLEHNFIDFWMYQWDTPKAEHGLQSLNIDRDALAQLFRNPKAAGLLRIEAIDDVSSLAGRTAFVMRARTETELAQLLSELGDLSYDEIAERSEDGWEGWITDLESQGRAERVEFEVDGATESRWVAANLAEEYRQAIADPCDYGAVRRVVARYLARSGPVSVGVLQARYPIASVPLSDALEEMLADSRAAKGYFRDEAIEEWLDLSTLARIQERTLSILRSEVRPSAPLDYQAAMLQLHGISTSHTGSESNSTAEALDVLKGVPIPTEQWVRDVLPARVDGFRSVNLERLVDKGDFSWVFCQDDAGSARGVALVNAGDARAYLPSTTLAKIIAGPENMTAESMRVYDFVISEGVADSETILAALPGLTPSQLTSAIRDLALSGHIAADSWRTAMAISNSTTVGSVDTTPELGPRRRPRHYSRRLTSRRQVAHRLRETQNVLAPGATWSATSRFGFLGPDLSDTQLATQRAEALLKRHGVVTRRAIENDQLGWDWRPIYDALNLMELRGIVRRGYFVNGLPGVQFASVEFVETMRAAGQQGEYSGASVVAASDPAYIFDRKLASISNSAQSTLLDFSRNSTTRIVFAGGLPIIVAYSNGARISSTNASDDAIEEGIRMLARLITQTSPTKRVVITEWNGAPAITSPAATILSKVGFRRDYPNMVVDALNLPTRAKP